MCTMPTQIQNTSDDAGVPVTIAARCIETAHASKQAAHLYNILNPMAAPQHQISSIRWRRIDEGAAAPDVPKLALKKGNASENVDWSTLFLSVTQSENCDDSWSNFDVSAQLNVEKIYEERHIDLARRFGM